MNGYNFTERVRKVLALAREEASRLHHMNVGTEHILLGMISEGEGVGTTVLENLGVNLDNLRQITEKLTSKDKTSATTGPDLPYTARAKKVLEFAMAEARQMNHQYVGTEHMLLGLLREEKGIAAKVLTGAGVTTESARVETIRLLGVAPPARDPARGPAHREPREGIASIMVELRLSDGSVVREEFPRGLEAIEFIGRQYWS